MTANWRCWIFGHKWGTQSPTDTHYCRQCSTCRCRVHGCTDCHRGLFDLPWCAVRGGDGKRPTPNSKTLSTLDEQGRYLGGAGRQP